MDGAAPDAEGSCLGEYHACAKLILLGEHFVVHGAPALALPLHRLATRVRVHRDTALRAPALVVGDGDGADAHALRLLAAARERLGLTGREPWRVEVTSSIPLGQGLGSSAAFAVALIGALVRAAGAELSLEQLQEHAHTLERLSHGSPSGIDDTVATFARPVWFIRGEPARFLEQPDELALVLAASGAPGSTRRAVSAVQLLQAQRPDHFAALCDRARQVTLDGRGAFLDGDLPRLGRALDRQHELLQAIGVSSEALDRLVESARAAGALGAKLTGSGGGGFMVALVDRSGEEAVAGALAGAGAPLVLRTRELLGGEERV